MNKILQQVFIIIISFFIIGISSLGYHLYKRQKRNYDNVATYEHMLNATMRQYHEDGSLKTKLITKNWVNYQNEKYSTLDAPTMTIYKQNGKIWNIVSKKATILENLNENNERKKITLSKDVHINRNQTTDSSKVDLFTQELHYFPDSSNIETNEKVELNQPGLIIQGKGLIGNLDAQDVKILNNVKTKYNPTSN